MNKKNNNIGVQQRKENRHRIRSRLCRVESFSEPNLTTANRERQNPGLGLGHSAFPPGFTVDELRWYRKKKPPGNWGPKDNLTTEDGSMKKFKSEYKRCYRHFKFLPTSCEDLTGSQEDLFLAERRDLLRPLDGLDYLRFEEDVKYDLINKNLCSIENTLDKRENLKTSQTILPQEGLLQTGTEKPDKCVTFQTLPRTQISKRSSLGRPGQFMVASEMHSQDGGKRTDVTRRPTSLRLVGDMKGTSETTDQFSGPPSDGRDKPVKQHSTLKLEGDIDTTTEQKEKYVAFSLPERAPLVKRQTNLQLEGDMDIKTEKQDKFIPYNVEKRPPIVKRDTNLQLEGEMSIQTEKRDKYVPYELSSRQKVQKRPTNLRLDGTMETQTEKNAKHIAFEVQKRPPLQKKDTNLQLEGNFIMTPEYKKQFIEHHIERVQPKRPVNNLGLHIDDNIKVDRKRDHFFDQYQKPFRNLDTIPSYKENYITHKIEKTHSKKPKENLKPEGTIDLTTETQSKFTEPEEGKKVTFPRKEVKQKRAHVAILNPEGQLESTAEYSSSYVDFPRERPVLKKPESSLKTEGHVSHLSEKSSAYVSHGPVTRPALARREDSLKMDETAEAEIETDAPEPLGSRFECQPEYRKAYNDYLQRENLTRKPRKLIQEAEDAVSKIPLPKSKPKRAGSKSPKPSSSKSRSVSPGRHVPRTPLQQRVLVPDMGEFTPRRPSSIFGPKTGRWYPRTVSPGPSSGAYGQLRHCSDDEWECRSCRRCSPCCDCHHCHRSVSRWDSECQHSCSPRCHSPSPPRRLWSRAGHESHHTHTSHSLLRSEEKPASFVVLTDKVEINNNRLHGVEDANRSNTSCCKDQKWMPPWYEPPM